MKIRPTQPAPKAKKRAHTQTRFGTKRTDNYAWMRDENWQQVMRDPATLDAKIRKHLEAENTYTEAALEPVTALKEAIFAEMKGRLEPTAREVPMPDGPYAYFHFYREGGRPFSLSRGRRDEASMSRTSLSFLKIFQRRSSVSNSSSM